MEKLVSHLLWYNRRLVSTVTTKALTRLADLLERGDYQAVRRYISTLDDALDIRNGENACVETDGSRFSVVLPEALLPAIGKALKRLVSAKELSEFRLSSLDQRLAIHSEHDWVLRRVECEPEPDYDYTPEPDGAEWDAVVFPETRTVKSLESAWAQIVRWSVRPDPHHTNKLHVNFDGPSASEEYAPRTAFSVFLDRPDAWQVVGYRRVPIKMRYGEALDWLQVWFEEDRIVLIVQDHLAETGSFDWDVENFFVYRALVKAVCRTVRATRFAWWICANRPDASEALEIGALDDIEALWDIFKRSANPDRNAARAKFEAAFAAGTVQE